MTSPRRSPRKPGADQTSPTPEKATPPKDVKRTVKREADAAPAESPDAKRPRAPPAKPSAAKASKARIAKPTLPDAAEMQRIRERALRTRRWVGAHVGASGGVHMSLANSMQIGGAAVALFLKSQRRWESPPLSGEVVRQFAALTKETGIEPKHMLPHGSYLVNLGNPDAEKREKAFGAFLDDLQRCEQLGIPLYNFHPGSTVKQCTEDESIRHIADNINRAHKLTKSVVIVMENTAGGGGTIGRSFAELAALIARVDDKSRIGVCLDTCHCFAAGYDVRTAESFGRVMDEFEQTVGLEYLRGMHLNDSKAPFGSNRDRHENLGKGHIGLECFRFIMTDPRFQDMPLILETPNDQTPNGKEDPLVWQREIDLLYSFCP